MDTAGGRAAHEPEIEQLRRQVAELQQQVDEHRDLQAQLEQYKERFRLLFEATREGIALFDRGLLVEANPRFVEMLGYDTDEVIGKNALDFIVPEEHEWVGPRMRMEYSEPYEVTAVRKDGTRFVVEACPKTLPPANCGWRFSSCFYTPSRSGPAEQADLGAR